MQPREVGESEHNMPPTAIPVSFLAVLCEMVTNLSQTIQGVIG